jgi:peptidoglycan/LPS O-acetylase OafA/YrhL
MTMQDKCAVRTTSVHAYLQHRQDNFLLLRILAALAVIYGHSFALARADGSNDVFLRLGWGVYSGELAVNVFFVVSGFMVSGSYLARNDLADYAKARLLRIVPAYVAVLLGCAFVIGPLFTTLPLREYFASSETLNYVLKNLKFSSDMGWTLPGVFEGRHYSSVNGSLWTLPAEMRMYLFVAALCALGLLRSAGMGSIVVIALLALGFLRPELFALHQDWFRLAGFFCLGILVQLNRDKLHVRHSAMIMLVFITYVSARTEAYRYLLSLTIVYFCFWFAYRTPHWKWLERWGDPSYGIYLWGWPSQQIIVTLLPQARPWQNFVMAALLAIALGYCSWLAIERPALALKKLDWPEVFRKAGFAKFTKWPQGGM